MQKTILVIDSVSSNRIMLKVQLSASWYHVVQTDKLTGAAQLVQRCRPDLIIAAMQLNDGSAYDLKQQLCVDPALARIPVIAVTAQNDKDARLQALRAGIDDVLSQPVDDVILQARIRRLLLARSQVEELAWSQEAQVSPGLSEPDVPFEHAMHDHRIALLTRAPATGPVWRSRLKPVLPFKLECHQMSNVHTLMTQTSPAAVILELPGPDDPVGFRLLSDLRARGTTREAIIIAVPNPADTGLAAEALDRGAHDVLPEGFCAQELALRLSAQLRRKAVTDQMRRSVRSGLNAAMRDPMTGLFNRGYALPRIKQLIRSAQGNAPRLSLLMIDLDHFKRVNDQYGHRSGDVVLIETARRMRALLPASSMIARVGGEEFLVALPDVPPARALQYADALCRSVNDTPFCVPGTPDPIHVTTSIGIAAGLRQTGTVDDLLADMIDRADKALYNAKTAGRNQVTLAQQAA